MVTPRGRFCHRHTCLQWKCLYSGHCGSISKSCRLTPSPQESAYGYGDSRAHVQPRLQVFRPSRRYCFRPGSSVYLPCMEELLQTPRCDRSLSSGYHPQTNGQTERKIQEIGRFLRTFCHDHQDSWPSTPRTPFISHLLDSLLSVRARFPATHVPLDQGTI